MALTQWQLKPVATETTIASGDFLAFTDEDEAGDPINKITIDNLATFLAGGSNLSASSGVLSATDTNTTYTAASNGGIGLSGTAFSLDIDGMTDIGAGVATGDLLIIDDGAGGANRKTTVDRIATLFAGTGLTATSSVIAVDAAQTGITSLGTQVANFAVGNGYGVVIGTATQETISIGDGATDLVPELQVLGTAAADSSMLLAAFSTTATTAGSPILAFAKGGNATLGSHTVVTDGEELGNIIAFGDDGTDLETPAASIQFEVDGTPGSGDMPGRIILGTTADGATAVTEAVRIDSSQNSTFAGNLTMANDTVINLADEGQIVFTDDTPSADHSGTGIVLKMTALTGLGLMECVHIDSNGKLNEADADAASTMPAIGIALEANSSGSDAEVKILIQGVVVDASWSFTPGADLFVGTTDDAGAVTATAPSGSGDTVQKIGVALTSTSAFLNFNTTEVLLA